MKNGLFRICSMILVVVLLVNMLPLQIFAEQLNTGRVEQSQMESVPVVDDTSETRIVEEIPQKRTEFSKEFLLENGLHMITVYPEAVHYATQSGWEEIDNTLIAKADGTITNTAGVWDVSFPQQLSQDKSISVQKDGYTLSFFMAGEITDGSNAAVKSTYAAKAADLEAIAITNMKQSAATIQETDLTALQAPVKQEQTVLQKAYSKLTYANVYHNTDVIYDLNANKVKESVILESYNSALRGYRYTLDVGTMIPVLEESGQIVFYDAGRENVVFVMPAPYMIDDEGEYNNDVQVELTGSGSRYIMTYLLPRQWLAAEDRAWPVILDPVVQPQLTTTNIRDRTVITNDSFSQTWGMNACGRYSSGKYARTFLKYDNLPDLTSSDVVVEATVHMYLPEDSSTVSTVNAHKVLDTWASETISWTNKPDYDTTIEDYAIAQAEDWYCWDITDVVRGWYDGENTGVMFKVSDEVETGNVTNVKEFHSSDYQQNTKPILSITFRNNNGLESYWDYTSASAGRSGTGYVNNFTGNLIWVREDMGFGGNKMPVSINHIYNVNDAYSVDNINNSSDANNSNDTAGNGFGLGNGWRTNYNQLVYQWSVDSRYYVWEDADGTDHYFERTDNGDYKDEDGLELTLTVVDYGGGKFMYEITDKNGNISFFDTQGRLFRIQNNQDDASGIGIGYIDDTSRLISVVIDSAGREYHFEYQSGLLYKISYLGYTMEDVYYHTTFEYENNNLVFISENDAANAKYAYGPNNLLTYVRGSCGDSLNYTYNTTNAGQPARVASVTQSYGDELCDELTFEYAHNQTTVTDISGNTLIYQFNNFGNTISVQDDEGHAQYYKFAINGSEEPAETNDETIRANQLRVSSKLQNTVGNMLNDSSFEHLNYWDATSGDPSVLIVDAESYHGNNSLRVITSAAATGVSGEIVSIGPGQTVTFSAYIKTGTASVSACIFDWTGQTMSEELAPNSDWTRLEVSYTNNSSASKNICPHILTWTPGTFWVDGVQMELCSAASRYNLVENGDFRYGGDSWSSETGLGSTGAPVPQLEGTTFAIPGSPTDIRHLIQTVKVNGGANDSFVLAGWAKGNSAPLWEKKEGDNDREFALQLLFNYTDGSTSSPFTAQFNPDSNEWQYVATAAVAEKEYSSVTVQAVYDYNVNTVLFDGIQLFKEEFGTSYTYDDEGNVIAATDLQKQNTTYDYDTNNNLTEIVQSNGSKMTYTYDDYHNVLTATTETGQVYNFEYDRYGNNTKVSTTVGGVTMSTSATYSGNGNWLLSTTDALGKTTTYGYSEETGLLEWVRYPEDTFSTRTNYTYNSLNLLSTARAYTDTGRNMHVSYAYDWDVVSGISTYTTDYTIFRGAFGLPDKIYAGEYNLAKYIYTDDGKYNLSILDYGNEGSVQYNYDNKDRLTKETFEDGDTVTYAYNNDGDLAIVTDSATGITTKYYYDLIGRMVKQEETGGNRSHRVQYTYDSINNLESLKETINGVDHTNVYEYDEHNRIKSVTNGISGECYIYDSFSRVQQTIIKDDDDTYILTKDYTFTAPSANATSGQIATNRLQATDYDVTYSYTYDGNGNILSISDGTNITSYEYDSANQLIRENNQAGGFTHTWEYDHSGNILNRKEYAYTTGTLGTPTDTVNYTYGDENYWEDRLYNYDDLAISVDSIGNTLSDGTWTYTWEHGRELATMSNGAAAWSFTYDANGMRTKRTNGGTTYEYFYNGSSLSQMTVGSNTLYFAYGANGVPVSVVYNNATYYYVTNIQGDVIAILNTAGSPVVHYSYDAWGNPISTTGTMASTLGAHNPLRYRGYVYDQELGLYYLQSRYYNPEWGRFINADGFASTGQGILGNNMFAYCNNNPVVCVDTTGQFPWLAVGIIAVCAVVGGVLGYNSDRKLWESSNEQNEPDVDTSIKKPSTNTKETLPEDSDTTQQTDSNALTTGDKIMNALIGGGLGFATGGAIVASGGAVGSVAVGSATSYIAAFGGTGAQTFAIGAFAYDIWALIIAPFLGLEVEPIEYEP